jgi:hypothetical protein
MVHEKVAARTNNNVFGLVGNHRIYGSRGHQGANIYRAHTWPDFLEAFVGQQESSAGGSLFSGFPAKWNPTRVSPAHVQI